MLLNWTRQFRWWVKRLMATNPGNGRMTSPDVVLMDINMPVMDGIKATEI